MFRQLCVWWNHKIKSAQVGAEKYEHQEGISRSGFWWWTETVRICREGLGCPEEMRCLREER